MLVLPLVEIRKRYLVLWGMVQHGPTIPLSTTCASLFMFAVTTKCSDLVPSMETYEKSNNKQFSHTPQEDSYFHQKDFAFIELIC